MTLAVVIIITEIVFVYFMAPYGVEFVLSSVLLTLAVLGQLWFGMCRDAAIPADIVAFIFSWLFLDLAPKIQLLSMPGMLVNTSTVVPALVQVTNLMCALFIFTYTVVYASINRRLDKKRGSVDQPPAVVKMQPQFTPIGLGLALAACVVVVAALGGTPYETDAAAAITPSAMVIKKFLLFIPSATLLIFVHEMIKTRQKWAFSKVCVLLVLILLVAFTENPLTEKRNALGPVYLGLVFVVFESKLRSLNRRLLLLVASMALVFPAITVLTHSHRQFLNGVKLDALVDTLKEHYFSVNYDAWANIYTIAEMVQRHGIGWGRQLLGDLLFFVPSSIWHDKPIATGIAIGDFLIMHHSGWFTNLSAPLVGEAYIDFGSPGIVLYAVGAAYLIAWLNRIAKESSNWISFPFAIYSALFLMFVLRGSLMIAFAYGTGAVLAFLAASALLSSGHRRIGQRYFRADAGSIRGMGESLPEFAGPSFVQRERG